MWSLIQSALSSIQTAFESFKKKPEPMEVPEPVDATSADDLLKKRKK